MKILARIPVSVAAAIMGTGVTFIQNGLKHGALPFGTATSGNPEKRGARYSYHISPAKFMEYTGVTDTTLRKVAASIGQELKYLEVGE